MNATPPVRRINSVDSCDNLVGKLHGETKRSGIFAVEWHTPDGRLVARSRFERKGFTNRIEVAPERGRLDESP